jgi:hypothetical protein
MVHPLLVGGVKGRKRSVVLPRGLTDRRANHDLKNLVLLRPDARAATISSSVTLWAWFTTLSTSVLVGLESPALSNAARR